MSGVAIFGIELDSLTEVATGRGLFDGCAQPQEIIPINEMKRER
jgi:hypothetical protein